MDKKEVANSKDEKIKENSILEKSDNNTNHFDDPVIEPDILKDIPPEAKKVIEYSMRMQSMSGPMPNPLMAKITEKHIDKILDQSALEESNSFEYAKSSKKYNMAYFILGIALFIFCNIFN